MAVQDGKIAAKAITRALVDEAALAKK